MWQINLVEVARLKIVMDILRHSFMQILGVDAILGHTGRQKNLLSKVHHLDLSGESIHNGPTAIENGMLHMKPILIENHVFQVHLLIEQYLVCP